ncbi:hypothetical protein TELCIR_14101 [Teladorsagia circumcincta]|uniref:Uncharacterized protein n=1 Tax=Teladorsagia circumcincta TaxID=45464 RepID=A0A2G9U1Y8_TELCI|nr:hypothetical protein TELCIR_14101 [Teladorsagia circumcincta]
MDIGRVSLSIQEKEGGYTTAPDKQHGAPDPDAVTNIQLASAIGLRTEVYMVPQIGTSGQTGAQQLEEMYSHLLDANIIVKSVWIEVTHRSGWSLPFAASRNVDFLNSFLQRANIYGLSVGILTNLDEWNEITGSATINNVMLWYFKTNGTRTFADSPANFDDFVPFAGWTSPTAKRIALSEKVCGQYSNRDIYSTSSASVADMARREESDRYVVGGLGLGSTALPGRAEIR